MARFVAVEAWLNNHLTSKTGDAIDDNATRVRRAAASPSCTGPASQCSRPFTSVADETIPIALGVA